MQGVMIDASADGRVLAFALVLTIASSVLFGLAPALHVSKPDLHKAMKADISGTGRRSGSLQGTLLAGQVAISMVLMISAGLLLRGLYATQTVEPGFNYENVAVASFDLSGAGYDAARAVTFQRQLAERVGSLPGTEGVAHVMTTPLTMGGGGFMARLPGQDQPLLISFNAVSANYFALLGLPIVRGRTFTDAELAVASGGFTGSGVMIVTEATARRFWPDQDPLGQTLIWGETPVQVVGVAKDAEITRVGEVPSDYAYLPADEAVQGRGRLQLLVKSGIDFAATSAGIRAVAAELDRALVVRVTPLEANLDIWRGLARLAGGLATSLGALALVLAAVGVYGVVAYAVGLRVREIGIRRALGANAKSVVALMMRRTMRPVGVGAIVGAAAAAGLSRILTSVLFGVSPLDPVGLGLAALFVLAVALTAGFLPARRATRVDPMTTLRYE
jgi:predicted permease